MGREKVEETHSTTVVRTEWVTLDVLGMRQIKKMERGKVEETHSITVVIARADHWIFRGGGAYSEKVENL